MTAQAAREAAEAAQIIVDNGAVYVRTSGDPFFFTSGWASPVFIDIKRLIALPSARTRLIELALGRMGRSLEPDGVDVVVGCELAGVPFAAIMADRLGLPLVIVRKQRKGFGRLAQFEGAFQPGQRALIVDDLSTDGITKSTFRAAVEQAEARVVETFVFLDYQVFPAGDPVMSLLTLADIIAASEATGRLTGHDLSELKAFADDAPAWSHRNGGIATRG